MVHCIEKGTRVSGLHLGCVGGTERHIKLKLKLKLDVVTVMHGAQC